MTLDALSAVRGLLAFVSFTELVTAARCVLPFLPTSPAGNVVGRIFSLTDDGGQAARVLSLVYGLYCFLNGLIVLHLAVFAHYRPLASLGVAALCAKLILILTRFKTIDDLIFELVSCLLALAAALAIPVLCAAQEAAGTGDDENTQLLRTMRLPKSKKKKHE